MLGTLTHGAVIPLAVIFLMWRFGAEWLHLVALAILCTAVAWWLRRQQRDRLL